MSWTIFFLLNDAGASEYTVNLSQYVIIQENIKTNIVLATSVSTSGYAVGSFLWPIVYKILLDTFSWRGAFLIQGAMGLNNVAFILMQTSPLMPIRQIQQKECHNIRKNQEPVMQLNMPNENDDKDIEIVRKRDNKEPPRNKTDCNKLANTLKTDLCIWEILMTLGHFVFWFGDAFSYFMVAVRLDYIGLSREQMVTVMAARGFVGLTRIIPSYIIDRFQFNRIKVLGTFALLMGIFGLISVTFRTFPLILVYFIFWGFSQCKYNAIVLFQPFNCYFLRRISKNEEILTTLSLLELSQTNPKHVENMLQMSIGG